MANLSPTLEQAFLVANRATEETLNSNPEGCNQYQPCEGGGTFEPTHTIGGGWKAEGNLPDGTPVTYGKQKVFGRTGQTHYFLTVGDKTRKYLMHGPGTGEDALGKAVSKLKLPFNVPPRQPLTGNHLETLLANVSGKTRRETLNGREYIVAPVRMIVEGVLNGSKGPLFYPQPEINRDYQAWNGMPIVVYHPTNEKGEAVSARSAKVLNKSGIGMVLESKTESGPLDAEGWFDVEATKRVDNRVYERLLAGKPIELSTGLFTDNHPAPRGATFNGKPYSYVARNYRPDHLAVLPDQKGACSLNDGCGVLVNKGEGETTLNKLWTQFKTLFKQLDEAANPTENSNPEGCNQHTGPGCGGKNEVVHKFTSVSAFTGEKHDLVVAKTPEGKYFITRADFSPTQPATDAKLFDSVKSALKGHKDNDRWIHNALPNQPKSLSTGKFKSMNAGLGRGEAHEAAQRGSLTLTERDGELGVEARQQADSGKNPPSWAVDESKWERAKTEADKGNYEGDTYWAVVSRIYQNMGGEIKSSTTNSNPEGCNQHTGPGCSGEGSGDIRVQSRGRVTDLVHSSGKKVEVSAHKQSDGTYKYRVRNPNASMSLSTSKEYQTPLFASKAEAMDYAKGYLNSPQHKLSHYQQVSPTGNKEYECNGEEDCECPECKSKMTGNTEIVDWLDVESLSEGDRWERVLVGNEIKYKIYYKDKGDHSGSPVDNSSEGEPDMAKLNDVDRKKLVDGLITNCSCQTANIWKEDDRETLNSLSDEKLTGLIKQRKSMLDAEAVVNVVKEVGGSELTVNAMPDFIKEKMKGKAKPKDDEEDEEEEVPAKGKKVTDNQSRLTPEEKEDLAFARRVKTERKTQIINQLVANASDENRDRLVKNFQAKPLSELEDMLQCLPTRNEESEQRSAPLYYGVGGSPSFTSNRNSNFDEDDILPIPTVNWEQEYAAQRKKANSNAD